ncbi:hypothetical protein PRZ48_003945 [Zasmidium cellare]|uniref:Heterokaryon incompatibility domain-containing protein n=1 Tax=Zasmidium cellare TaxID=395010 RepID=A0ABR0EY35_ZASCE|nr:hypothetical protein PRZ48_003945 [Zasmidium cellare]
MELSKILTPYTPLDRTARDIRLITLLPTLSDHKTLRCIMTTYSLDTAPPFTALSYEWGSMDDQCIIQVNDSPARIRKNLWLFLNMAVRQKDLSSRSFWIDALCIDQSDLKERSHQVSLMAKIYQGAELVVSWLGPPFDASDVALDHLTMFTASLSSSPKSRDEEVDAILQLCRRNYWSRLWVLQELVLAAECTVYAGEKSASIGCLEAYLGHAAFTALATGEGNSGLSHVASSRLLLDSPASTMFQQRRRGPFTTPILTSVLACGDLKCHDRKDKVYAVLGISQPTNLSPDYTISTCQVFNRLLKDGRAFDQCKSLAEARSICDKFAKAVGVDVWLDILSSDDRSPPGDYMAALIERHQLREDPSGIPLWWTREYGHLHLQRLWLCERHDEVQKLLNWASKYGHEIEVQTLLDAGIDAVGDEGEQIILSALHEASYEGHHKIVQILLQTGIHPDAGRHSKSTGGRHFVDLLDAASFRGHEKVVRVLLDNGADVNARIGVHGHALRTASLHGHEKTVRELLKAGANVNAAGEIWGTALQLAFREGHTNLVRILIAAGADVNAQDEEFDNMLQWAAFEGKNDILEVLVDAAADVHAERGLYDSALSAAACGGHKEAVHMLIRAGANVNAKTWVSGNVLQQAALEGDEEVVQILLNAGADVHAEGGHYGSALSAAACGGNKEAVQMLIHAGANVNTRGGVLGNALQAAVFGGDKEVVETVLDAGAVVNAEGGYYGCALGAAVAERREEVAKILVRAGARFEGDSVARGHGRKFGKCY